MTDKPGEEIVIRDYDSRWPNLYAEEAARVWAALGDIIIDMAHVGSTAVPGLAAKPIIDITVAVRSLEEAEQAAPRLEALGYQYMGEFGLPGRLFFQRGSPRTYHVHLVLPDSAHWRDHLVFRDYLRAHPDEARRYETLKRALAVQFRHARTEYTSAKSAYIQSVLAAARQEQTRG